MISGMDGRPVSNVELQLPNLMQISQKISQLAITTRGYRLTLIIPVSQGSRLPGTKFLEINPVGRCSCVSRAPPILAHHFISCFFFSILRENVLKIQQCNFQQEDYSIRQSSDHISPEIHKTAQTWNHIHWFHVR